MGTRQEIEWLPGFKVYKLGYAKYFSTHKIYKNTLNDYKEINMSKKFHLNDRKNSNSSY